MRKVFFLFLTIALIPLSAMSQGVQPVSVKDRVQMAADAIKKEREAADDWEKAQKAFKAVEKEYTSMSKVAKFRDKYLSDGPVLE